jgi:isoamylase
MDYSGCGNTVNCSHPIVEKFIVDCLEFWVREMHVDGFRFDEGSILARGQDGAPLAHPPVVWSIELSDCMRDTKIIAEAWDAAGLYQIGYFPGYRWAEWNGRFRDDIRRFVKGDVGMVGAVAARIAGSADIYQVSGHLPINSVNFVTCHDGFTLNDLVSHNDKHNEANGEGDRDGINDNLSWNCGCEGDTDDPAIEALRERQIKNFAAILMLSRGVPMFVAGDEVRRTQKGNNNAYCQPLHLAHCHKCKGRHMSEDQRHTVIRLLGKGWRRDEDDMFGFAVPMYRHRAFQIGPWPNVPDPCVIHVRADGSVQNGYPRARRSLPASE